MSKPVFCLLGPTASGKTGLAMALADRLPVDIISVDSALVYREMDIGTAKPTLAELSQYPHQNIDLINPDETYSAACFMQDVNACIKQSLKKQRIPLLVGGTMMYFQSIQQGLSQLPTADASLRADLLQQGQQKGWSHLHDRLHQLDAKTAARVHPHDQQRIQRALEVCQLSGVPMSRLLQASKPLPYAFENILLLPADRVWLHERIAHRFTQMLTQGLVEETAALLTRWPGAENAPSMRMVGYRQTQAYIRGDTSYDEFVQQGIAATRQLAKRQITWLRKWPYGRVIRPEETQKWQRVILIIEEILDNRSHRF